MDKIINVYGNYSSQELVELLHKEESLWTKKVKEENLELYFKYKIIQLNLKKM
ncbi:MAG: hypothetical protein B6I24_03425 [Bacteroidetes bacterium 4572_128]|nr:MAG: hypothetical protein B6I24_03425 [Bacteroidetes bacterium 4572_128]